MGQQQLLLLVLGIVIVGLAVVVGIQAFGENQKKANSDALVNDAVRIASDAQAWKLKPAAFGGGAGIADEASFNDGTTTLTLAQLGYEIADGNGVCTAGQYENLNGCFTIAAANTGLTITGQSAANDNQVVVAVNGTTPNNITTTVSAIP
jgi:hypothetical protein